MEVFVQESISTMGRYTTTGGEPEMISSWAVKAILDCGEVSDLEDMIDHELHERSEVII